MSNEINKIDGLSTVTLPTAKPAVPSAQSHADKSAAVEYSSTLDQMVKLMATEIYAASDTDRVQDVKQKLDQGNYHVNMDKLAQGLADTATSHLHVNSPITATDNGK